jgi:PHP family Zn ribbon phosphoesterase
MLTRFTADLHMHTCLSPCAELDMTPRQLVLRAKLKGLHLIAVTDHNSLENAEAARRAAKGTGLTVFPGMEITSSEEVHILGIFEHMENAALMQELVYENLPPEENDERLYGHQVVVNEHDEVVGFNRRLLITATRLSASTLVAAIQSFNGLSIASHIDKESFSVLSQLAFIPESLKFDALEMSPLIERNEAEETFKELKRFPWVSFSDAHFVRDIGKRVTTFTLKELTFSEIRKAFMGIDGRDIGWH